MTLRHGQRWEFVNEACGTITEYELEHFERDLPGPLARLRNIETGGMAHVSCHWLRQGDSVAPNNHWRYLSPEGATA
jgi:hypothetical protein